MARRNVSLQDFSSHATSELEYVIKREKKKNEPHIHTVSADQAMRGQRFIQVTEVRDVTRVPFISQNEDLLNPTTQSLDGYVKLADLFEEVHILILRTGIAPKFPVLRVDNNVWIYTAAGSVWWESPLAGLALAREQLVFAGGFRPDIIIARDPFESALVAWRLARKYNRPMQLHVLEDYGAPDFVQRKEHNRWRQLLTNFTIPRFASVRALTSVIEQRIARRFEIPDLTVLPKFQNYQSILESKDSIDLKARYQPFLFVMLYVGYLGHQSTLHRALDAARFVLRNPYVGLIVLGDGPARAEFESRAKVLDIAPQVVFASQVPDIVPYLRSANLLIVTDTDSDSEEVVLRGAAAGIPMVLTRTEQRADSFTDGEDAFLCEPDDIQGMTNCIDELLNDIDLRKQFVTNAREVITGGYFDDLDRYRESYRLSIEQAFFVGEATGTDEATEDEVVSPGVA